MAVIAASGCASLDHGADAAGGGSTSDPFCGENCTGGSGVGGGIGEPYPPEPVESLEKDTSGISGPTPALCEVVEARRYVVDLDEGGSLARAQYALEAGAKNAPLHSLDLSAFRRFFAPRFADANLSLSLRPMGPDAALSPEKGTPAILQVRVPVSGAWRTPLDVIVAVDVAPRMQPASNVTSSVLEGLHASLAPDDKLTVIAFSEGAEVVVLDATSGDPDALTRLSDFTTDLKAGAAMREGHSVKGVFELAEQLAGEPTADREKALLFVSDGLLFGEAESLDDAMAPVRAWRDANGVRTVGFVQVAPDPGQFGVLPALRTTLLDKLSEDGGGVTLFAANPDRARSFFAERGIGLLARSGPAAQLSVLSKLFDFALGGDTPVMTAPDTGAAPDTLPVGVVTVRDIPVVLPCPWVDFAVPPIAIAEGLFDVSVGFYGGTDPLVASKDLVVVDPLDPLEKRDALIRAAVELARVSTDPKALAVARERATLAAQALRTFAQCDATTANPEDCAALTALEAFMAPRLTDPGTP
jgi:hypothetical protein